MSAGTVITSNASPDSLLAEPDFTRKLCLERKRTERSRRRFVLMLLDLGLNIREDTQSLEKILFMLSQSTRETDIAGWHKDGSVIGVIFTEIGSAEGRVVVNALMVSSKCCAVQNAPRRPDERDSPILPRVPRGLGEQ